jgi:hypothetical protein
MKLSDKSNGINPVAVVKEKKYDPYMLPELNTFADKPSTRRRTDMMNPKFESWPLIQTGLPFSHYFTGRVKMACHCYMVNPRICLEDCMRYGLGSFWATRLPWSLFDVSINEESFE